MGLQVALVIFGTALTGLQVIALYIINDMRERILRLEARAMGEQSSWDGSERRG
jgi:hypothetical protein